MVELQLCTNDISYESSKLLENLPFPAVLKKHPLSKEPNTSQTAEFPSNFLQGLEMVLLAHGHLLPRPNTLVQFNHCENEIRPSVPALLQALPALCPSSRVPHVPSLQRMSKAQCYVHAAVAVDDGVCLRHDVHKCQGLALVGKAHPSLAYLCRASAAAVLETKSQAQGWTWRLLMQ